MLQNKIFKALTSLWRRRIYFPEVYIPVIFAHSWRMNNRFIKRCKPEISGFSNKNLHRNMLAGLVFFIVVVFGKHLFLRLMLLGVWFVQYFVVYLLVNAGDTLLNYKLVIIIHIICMYRQDKNLQYHKQAKKMTNMSED